MVWCAILAIRPSDRSHTWNSKWNGISDFEFVFSFVFVRTFSACVQVEMHLILPVLALLVCLFFFDFLSYFSLLLLIKLKMGELRSTYVSIAVQCVVCQFDFIKANWLCLPMWSKCWTIWMNVHALCTLWFGAASRHPLAARKFVTAITERCHFKYNTVVRIFFQSG